MAENLPPERSSKSLWVPFRDSSIVTSARTEYGQIKWNPAFILHGNETTIDVVGTNKWLQDMRIGFPVEIKPYHPPPGQW